MEKPPGHEQLLAALAGEKHRLDSAVECMSEGMLILDRDYRFATLNRAARELLGVQGLDELAGKLRDGQIDPGLHPIFWLEAHGEQARPIRCWLLRECGQEACPAYGSGLFPCWLYDGTRCHNGAAEHFPDKLATCYHCAVYQSNAHLASHAQAHGRREVTVARPARRILVSLSAPIVSHAGEFLGAVKLLHDVTTERMMEQKRAEFTSFVTHELRTPLTSIAGFLKLVLGGYAGAVTDGQQRHLDAALQQCRRLERLVDTLLDMAAIEAGRLRLQRDRFDLMPVILECVEMLRPQAAGREVRLEVFPPDEPLIVTADRERILQVLTNLVANAVKYTEVGGAVEVALRPSPEGVVVEVADTGVGIPADDIPHLFERFYRANAGAGRVPGSGLGLAICKGILEAHGGRVWVESTPGKGSRFFFTIPRPGSGPLPVA